ncbi:SPW repeat domain-containing protein [Paractinoplanes hotanensis]|uniref:SPW repeat protein n=1 Tax=Paractinoplanes hotanensis TaxID=2906497 RepID=A0ABT0YEB0_9ACTN|nr:SPW repeat protein [Actinoplanes hotanensis]MCM4084368.1 SPW repeat protein [Actinoplanes hotanensis]
MAMATKPWQRWQDWITTAAGLFLALSPIWFDVDTAGAWGMAIIGAFTAVFGLIALYAPGLMADEILAIGAGVVAFVAPWVFSYSDYTEASWTSWVVGVIVALAGALALPASRAAHQPATR